MPFGDNVNAVLYIYIVNGDSTPYNEKKNKKQGGERSSGSLDIEDDFLKPGLHVVSAMQFADNDPSKEVVGYQEATFEIKPGS